MSVAAVLSEPDNFDHTSLEKASSEQSVPPEMPSLSPSMTYANDASFVPQNLSSNGDYNPMMQALVANDGDIIGLIAYSLYKQNKRDWMMAFAQDNNREPTPNELRSYIIGECTSRRLETYRRLGEDALVRLKPQNLTAIQAEPAPTSYIQTPLYNLETAEEKPNFYSTPLGRQLIVLGAGIVIGILFIKFGMKVLFG